MEWRRLTVEGVLEFTARRFDDSRGYFTSPFLAPQFLAASGRRLFPLEHLGQSTSRRGVVRGIHYTAAPPGVAKYVYCPSGRVLDFVIDVRVGSPTFGQWDCVALSGDEPKALYMPVGMGHAFVALEDNSKIMYLLSGGYVPENERELTIFDPAIGLPIPGHIDPILSERDRLAPTLAQAQQAGLLPDYAECQRIDQHERGS